MEKKKILILDNGPLKNKKGDIYVTQSTGNLIDDLLSIGHHVELFQFVQQTSNDDFVYSYNVSKTGINIHYVKHHNSFKLFLYIWAYIEVLLLCSRVDFVYIFFPNTFRFIPFFLFNKSYGLNIRGERHLTDIFSKCLYRHAKVIFTVSPHFSDFVSKFNKKVYDKRPTIQFSENDILEREYFSKKYYKLLFLGRLDLEKGILDLVEAVSLLNERGISFELNIVGNGDNFAEIKNKIIQMGISNINLCGGVSEKEDIRQWYISSDLYILPTYHEGFPRTLYECMILGTPILTTFVGGIPFLMVDGYNCFQIEPHSPIDIADKVEYIINNYQSMKFICKNAQDTFINKMQSLPHSHGVHLGNMLLD